MSKRELAARLFNLTALGALLQRTRLGEGLLVVNYHRIGDPEKSRFDPALFSATAEAFDEQIRFFKRSFDVISPDDLPRIRSARGRYLQITFDDGYVDNHALALPILERHGVSATFFVATGYMDAPHVPWWDELAWMLSGSRKASIPRADWLPEPILLDSFAARKRGLRRLNALYTQTALPDRGALLDRVAEATGAGRCAPEAARDLWMTWDMVRDLHRRGMHIGGHTVHHVELSRFKREEQAEEITTSKRRIEEETGAPVRVFSYPFGWPTAFNDDTRICLRDAGISFAYSYYGGHQRAGAWDDHDLRRVAIEADLSPHLFTAMGTVPSWFARPSHEPLVDLRRIRRALSLS